MVPACKSQINPAISEAIEVEESDLYIRSDLDFYSLFMSSVPGLPLTGRFKSGKTPENIKYHWSTEYGSFLSWGEDGVVSDLGSDFSNLGEKVYWTPGTLELIAANEKIEIILELEDIAGLEVLATAKIALEATENGFSVID